MAVDLLGPHWSPWCSRSRLAAVVDRVDEQAGGPEWRDWHPEESV